MTRLREKAKRIQLFFNEGSLSRRFAIAGGIIASVAALLAGAAISEIVARSAVRATAASTALFMDSFLTSAVNNLIEQGPSSTTVVPLDRLLRSSRFVARFPHVEIWLPDGEIAYSTSRQLVGRHFPPPNGLQTALTGEIAARYTDLAAGEHTVRSFLRPFLEIYVPIRGDRSEQVVAVAEIHEITEPLEAELWSLRVVTWTLVVTATVLIMLTLYGIVRHGSRQIEKQRSALRSQLAQTRLVSEQNRRLRDRARKASQVVTQLNESILREIGAELHDGPAQLIGLAALRVEHARRSDSTGTLNRHLDEIEALLSDANLKVRNLSKGLVLPAIDDLPLCEVISRAARAHEQKTGTMVDVECSAPLPAASKAVNACAYRFVQEALNNAFRHADGRGQRIRGACRDGVLTVSVGDDHCSIPANSTIAGRGLGLTWIRARVESLGGTLQALGGEAGMTLTMAIPLDESN